eukprot:TRINITY_DN26740_c0_g1_i1.p1 TRINITY_DN26740_c0_g1~~TRINITY_DN26740_c0_g1_i1.p1  ORF type:complete len:237 (-),score=32.06 TRINITY_DN26740_c0_g1_i1:72-782(-)
MVSLAAVENVLARFSQETETRVGIEASEDATARVDALMRSWRPAHLQFEVPAGDLVSDFDAPQHPEPGMTAAELSPCNSRSSSFDLSTAGRSEASTAASPSGAVSALPGTGMRPAAVHTEARHVAPSSSKPHHCASVLPAGRQEEPTPRLAASLLLQGGSEWMPSEAQSLPSYAREKLLLGSSLAGAKHAGVARQRQQGPVLPRAGGGPGKRAGLADFLKEGRHLAQGAAFTRVYR